MRKERKQAAYQQESLELRCKRTENELKETKRKYEESLAQVKSARVGWSALALTRTAITRRQMASLDMKNTALAAKLEDGGKVRERASWQRCGWCARFSNDQMCDRRRAASSSV